MSSLQQTPTGYRLQFRLNGRSQTISLGRVRKPEAESFQLHLNRLLRASKGTGQLTEIDLEWVSRQTGEIRDRLIVIGLVIDAVDKSRQSFLDAFEDYRATRKAWGASTRAAWNTHAKRVGNFFGPQAFVDITTGKATDFKQHLLGLPLAENTARKTIGCCRQVCAWLMSHRKLTLNPFSGQPVGIGKAKRQGYVPAEVIDRILPKCPNNEWRLMFILSRWGGYRCPSEAAAARWDDIDWEAQRILVHSPKTKHHPNGEDRVMPLFPELRNRIEPIWHELPEGASEWMLPNLRNHVTSLHAPASKIIIRAKEKLWPRLFHNMRSSCQTDLCDRLPIGAVCAWLGNSTTIAIRHYLQVAEKHFQEALGERPKNVVEKS